MLSLWLDMAAPSTCLTFQIMVLRVCLSLIHWHISLCKCLLYCVTTIQGEVEKCASNYLLYMLIQRTVITLPFSPLWEIWIFLMHWVGGCVRSFTQHTGWQHRSCPYGTLFGKSLQSQVPCMTWDIIIKWVMLERRNDLFRNLLPVSEIFISVSFDKNSRKKEGR